MKPRLKTFFNNPKLKAAGVNMSFTQHQVEEFVKCKSDFSYFCENYVKIISLDKGLIPFIPRPYQRKLIKMIEENRFSIAKIPRQYGKTIIIMAYFLWLILFNENMAIAILANNGGVARKILAKLQTAYENLPFWLQQGVIEWNKGNIELENGSKVVANATTAAAGRSDSFNIILLDEFAFVPRNIADEFYKSVYPTLTSGTDTKIIMVSTPNGMNLFYKFWKEAEAGINGYAFYHVHWSEFDNRGEEWKALQVKAMGEASFDQEFGCEFIGSSNTLIAAKELKELVFAKPIFSNQGIDIYEHAIPGHIYAITVDVSHGQNQDSSAFSVFDITSMPFKQVAKFKDATINSLVYHHVIVQMAKRYNNAHVLVEINDIGKQVADNIWMESEYENLLQVSAGQGKVGQRIAGMGFRATQRGVKTSASTKSLGCAALKGMIENKQLIINDFDTISELTTFISSGSSYAAEEGSNDDLAMTLVIFGWLSIQDHFKDLSNTNLKKKLYQEFIKSQNENSVLPFVFNVGKEEEKTTVEPDGTVWVNVGPKSNFL